MGKVSGVEWRAWVCGVGGHVWLMIFLSERGNERTRDALPQEVADFLIDLSFDNLERQTLIAAQQQLAVFVRPDAHSRRRQDFQEPDICVCPRAAFLCPFRAVLDSFI